jgi:hypothetical protein
MRIRTAHLIAAALGLCAAVGSAQAQEFRIEEVPSIADLAPGKLKPKTIAFTDHRTNELTDQRSGLIRFSDWAQANPVQKQVLSLYPAYEEPTLVSSRTGKSQTKKLHMYVAEARFEIARAPATIDLARYATLAFVERMDPAIKHRLIVPADAIPGRDAKAPHNRNPVRSWCEEAPPVICIQSRYQLEGKLPSGIMLVNKLREGHRKIADYLEFQSELRVLPKAELDNPDFAKLTGTDTPVVGAIEQNIFHVNQVMQFGKFLALIQPRSAADASASVVTAFLVLAVETDLFEKQKHFENVPVLRNMVPAQVLAGNSSFNTGNSLSAGLPKYARNRIKAFASILEKE